MGQGYDATLGAGMRSPNNRVGEFLTEGAWTTELVTITVPQPALVGQVPQTILQALQAVGTPLRWAITSVNVGERTLAVEAVVIMPVSQGHELSR